MMMTATSNAMDAAAITKATHFFGISLLSLFDLHSGRSTTMGNFTHTVLPLRPSIHIAFFFWLRMSSSSMSLQYFPYAHPLVYQQTLIIFWPRMFSYFYHLPRTFLCTAYLRRSASPSVVCPSMQYNVQWLYALLRLICKFTCRPHLCYLVSPEKCYTQNVFKMPSTFRIAWAILLMLSWAELTPDRDKTSSWYL